jgi:hypothetical protein
MKQPVHIALKVNLEAAEAAIPSGAERAEVKLGPVSAHQEEARP